MFPPCQVNLALSRIFTELDVPACIVVRELPLRLIRIASMPQIVARALACMLKSDTADRPRTHPPFQNRSLVWRYSARDVPHCWTLPP